MSKRSRQKIDAIFLILALMFVLCPLRAQKKDFRHSIIAETNVIMMSSISYQYIYPIAEKAAMIFGGGYIMGTGFGYGSHWLELEAGCLFYGPKHYFHAGTMFFLGLNDKSSPGVKVAYRYQGKYGMVISTTAQAIFKIDPIFVPTIGLGFSF